MKTAYDLVLAMAAIILAARIFDDRAVTALYALVALVVLCRIGRRYQRYARRYRWTGFKEPVRYEGQEYFSVK